MSEFHELVKSVAKSREYVRDFYVYGFKSREDFTRRSARTYDNERRRLESWLAPYIKSEYNGAVKNVSLSLDSSALPYNPLYRVFEAKSFTDNDILLHFYILDLLHGDTAMTADELTDEMICRYEYDAEVQLVRKKANEYVEEGILCAEKRGKKLYYSLLRNKKLLKQSILQLDTAVSFYQLAAPLGFMGYSLMKSRSLSNESFSFKHGYFVHALEEEILLKLLTAMNKRCQVILKVQSNKAILSRNEQKIEAYPLRIFVSTRTGRRFLCVHLPQNKHLFTYRLDHIKEVTEGTEIADYESYQELLNHNLPKCFGTSIHGTQKTDTIKMTLQIMEPEELYILRRLETEGRGGTIIRMKENIYTYEISVYDGNEMLPWIRTFIGRILSFETDNEALQMKFKRDLTKMMKMYGISDSEEE